MPHPHFLRRLRNSLVGIRAVWRADEAFRWRVILVVGVIVLAVLADLPLFDYIVITISACAMLSAEIANTALEEVCDMLEPNFNIRVGVIKDMLSATVFVAALPLFALVLFEILPRFF